MFITYGCEYISFQTILGHFYAQHFLIKKRVHISDEFLI